MAKHVTSRSAAEGLPSPSGLEEGSAVVVGGVVHELRGGAWAASGAGLNPRGDYEYSETYDVGDLVAYGTQDIPMALWMATRATSSPPGPMSDVGIRYSTSRAATSPFAAQRFQVEAGMDVWRLGVSLSGSGRFGISATDPREGVQWLGSVTLDAAGYRTITLDSSVWLEPGTDYWLVSEGLVPWRALPENVLTQGGLIPAEEGFLAGSSFATMTAQEGSLLFSVDRFYGVWGMPLNPAWRLVFSLQSVPPVAPAGTLRLGSPNGLLWSVAVGDDGVLSATLPSVENATIETAFDLNAVSSWEGDTSGLLSAVENEEGPSVWFKWTAPAEDEEVSFSSEGSEYDSLVAVYTSTLAEPTSVADLTKVAEDNGGGYSWGDDSGFVSFLPVPGETYWIELRGYYEDEKGLARMRRRY